MHLINTLSRNFGTQGDCQTEHFDFAQHKLSRSLFIITKRLCLTIIKFYIFPLTMNTFNPNIEFQSADNIKQVQEIKLREHLAYIHANSPFYKRLFQKENIDVKTIRTLEDLKKIPTTNKFDLANNSEEFICVEKNKIVDYITTSGTLGDPVIFCMTDKDLERLAYNEAISLTCSTCNENDIIQLTTTIDKRFMAGVAYFLGARKMGAGIIRVGAGMPELQWDTIIRIKPTTLIAVPSFILKLIEYAEANGINYKNSSIKKAICIGEPLRKADFSLSTLAEKIKSQWNIELFSTYASTEMATAFADCEYGKGGHHHPELIIAEFLDDEGKDVPPGEPGELVITPLGVEGMPLLRFRTGDLVTHYTEPCECGRKTLRVGPVLGRKQQMIKLKGTTIYPPSIYELLNDLSEVENYIVELSTNNIGTDDVLVRIGCNNPDPDLEKNIKDHFRAKLRVSPRVEFESVEEIEKQRYPEGARKAVYLIDKR
jgi:phenylacetate-CoA ligase